MKNKIDIEKYYIRDTDKQLAEWANNEKQKTIALISGARRVGKTHSLRYLGQCCFERYEIIETDNLSDEDIKRFMDKKNRVNGFCEFLLSDYGITKDEINNKLLIVFDEIQEHNELKEAISDFNKILGCRFACTGSALWINDTNGRRATPDYKSFKIFPFSFVQFLEILKKSELLFDEKRRFFDNEKNGNPDEELIKLFRTYIVVGGMPQSLSFYFDNINSENVFSELNKWKETSIVKTYEKDLNRYDNYFKAHSLRLFAEYKNIIRTIGRQKDITDIKETYSKLEAMNIVILVKDLNNINAKLSSSINDLYIKPFLLDTGILFYYLCEGASDDVINGYYKNFILGKDSDDNGYLFENYVASTIVQNGMLPFYKSFKAIDEETNEKKEYEIDFVISNSQGVNILESKSGSDKEHKSLTKGLKRYNRIKKSYILSKSYEYDKCNIQRGPHNIPFYAVSFLLRK